MSNRTKQPGWRTRQPRRIVVGLLLGVIATFSVLVRRLPLWKLRYRAATIADALPSAVLPATVSVLPPPEDEYLGVWDVRPATARTRLQQQYGFQQLFRAYLHGYEHNGTHRYEIASCARRPNGWLSRWQLHVRLFPTGTGQTAVWCHYERNPNIAPIAHLREEGYDPARGKKRVSTLLADEEQLRITDEPIA